MSKTIEYSGSAWPVDLNGNADPFNPEKIEGTYTVTSDPGDGFMRIEGKGGTYLIQPSWTPDKWVCEDCGKRGENFGAPEHCPCCGSESMTTDPREVG